MPPILWLRGHRFCWLLPLILMLSVSGRAALQAPPLRGNTRAHDPGTIIKCKDRYYLFLTGYNIASRSSADKVFWRTGPNVFTNAPNWTTNAVPGFAGTFWAPDVMYLNGRYCLYYAVSTFGSQVSAIGLATNPTLDPSDPGYHWTDQGIVVASTNGSPYNTIDPSMVKDVNGNPWMSYGSYWNGIYVVQLDPQTGGRISPNSPVYHVAYNSSIEASYLFQRGGYYYLFVNWGSCCSGVNSTYNIRIGRSTNVTGPYLDKNGVDMAAGGGSLFLAGTGKFTGPGHVGILSEGGRQWFSYHYYDAGAYAPWYNAYGVANFDFEPLSWTTDNWPYFTNDWSAIYNFQADARDDNGQYYGLLENGATIQVDSTRGRVLNLNGTNQYVQLPPGVAFARTFTMDVKWNGGANWQRLFDFGVDTTRYFMLSPSGGEGKLHFDIRANGVTQSIIGPNPLPTNVWTHVALTLDGQQGILYVNGTPVATNVISLTSLDILSQTNSLGKSKFAADPYFNGQFANFRVYGRTLSRAEILSTQPIINQPADGSSYFPGTSITFSGAANDFAGTPLVTSRLTWRVNYVQDNRTNTVYGPVNNVTNGVLNIPANVGGGGSYQIILSAVDGAGHTGSNVVTLVPANPPASWFSYYPFTSDAGDINGHYGGTLQSGASIQKDPARGNVLTLSGTNQYVTLPAGSADFQTFVGWVKWNGGSLGQRIFDFGNDTSRYAYLTPSASNGKFRFGISLNGVAQEEDVDAPFALPIGTWLQVAVTLDGQNAILYTNGTAVATNVNVGLVPGILEAANNFLGRSQSADSYFNGQLSSVRIFSGSLGAADLDGPLPVINSPAQGSCYHSADTINFAGNATDISDSPLPGANLTWLVQWHYINTVVTVLGPTPNITNGTFVIPSSGSQSSNGYFRVTLTAQDNAGRMATNYVDIFPYPTSPDGTNWASFYPFSGNANDASNHFNGSLLNGANIAADAARGQVLNLPGGSQYVSLPSGVGAAQTVAAWVKWRGGNLWQRIFDFGQNTQSFFFLSPYVSDGNMQCAITPDAANYTQTIEAPELPTNTWTHVAVAMDGREGILYVNGSAVAVNNSVNLFPADVMGANNSYGHSQFAADPYFNGELDSIRLNSRTLSPLQIVAPSLRITQPSAGQLYAGGSTINFSGVTADYSDALLSPSSYTWSVDFHYDGIVQTALPLASGITNGSLNISTTAPLSTNVFYRFNLLATDAQGNQQSTYVDVLPQVTSVGLNTVPTGLQLIFDNNLVSTPTNLATVVGMNRNVTVPTPQQAGLSNFNFVVWSDGGAASHNVTVPASALSLTASFLAPTLKLLVGGNSLGLQWPDWAGAYSLWSATNLSSPVIWTPVTNVPQAANGYLTLAMPATNGNGFYRLQFP